MTTRDERERRRQQQLREINADSLDENGLIRDGHSFRVPLFLSDMAIPADDGDDNLLQRVVADAFPKEAGLRHRPGYIGGAADARSEIDKLYQLHDAEEAARWRNPPQHDTGTGSFPYYAGRPGDACMTDAKEPGRLVEEDGQLVCRATPRDAHTMTDAERIADREAAYREYQEWSENAWRRAR